MEKRKLTAAVAAMYWGAQIRVNAVNGMHTGTMMSLGGDVVGYVKDGVSKDRHYHTIDECQLVLRKLDNVTALTGKQALELLEMALRAEMLEVFAGDKLEGVYMNYEDDCEGATAYVIKSEVKGKDVALFINTKGDFSIAIYYDGEMFICGYQVAIINKLRGWGVDCDGLLESGEACEPVKTESDGSNI
jgi:hypothetical protein